VQNHSPVPGVHLRFSCFISRPIAAGRILTGDKGFPPRTRGLFFLCAFSFVLSFVFLPFTSATTLFVTSLLFAAWSSPLLLISFGPLFALVPLFRKSNCGWDSSRAGAAAGRCPTAASAISKEISLPPRRLRKGAATCLLSLVECGDWRFQRLRNRIRLHGLGKVHIEAVYFLRALIAH
jgi:hypothetical protein